MDILFSFRLASLSSLSTHKSFRRVAPHIVYNYQFQWQSSAMLKTDATKKEEGKNSIKQLRAIAYNTI
jgi:hypothetical protein